MGVATPEQVGLIGRWLKSQVCYFVEKWGASSEEPDPGLDRPVADANDAHVISSLTTLDPIPVYRLEDIPDDERDKEGVFSMSQRAVKDREEPLHKLIIDIDHEAVLIPSSTPGHYHLYVDLLIMQETYFKLLDALAEALIIEPGYAEVSKKRGHSDVRLPWVHKIDLVEKTISDGGGPTISDTPF